MKNSISTKAMQNAHIIASATDYTFSTCLKLGWKVAKGELDIKQAKKTREFSFDALLHNIDVFFTDVLLFAFIFFLMIGLIFGVIQANSDLSFDYGLIGVSCFALGIASFGDEFKSVFNKTIERV